MARPPVPPLEHILQVDRRCPDTVDLQLSITATWLLWLALAALVLFFFVAVLPLAVFHKRPHRSWFERSVLAFNSFIVLTAVVAAAGLTHYNNQLGDIPRQEFGHGVLAEKSESGEPQNFLLVGVDELEGLSPDDPILNGRDESHLADTIMVLRVDPEAESADLVSFPRDLWVPIAGTGSSDKINSALAVGGPDTLVQTIEENFGIPINHYVQVNLAGFKALVDAMGGVPIYFPDSVRAEPTGLYVEVPVGGECVALGGDDALAFVRSRTGYQTLIDDGWVEDATGDFGRIARQQLFIQKALDRAIDRGARNPIFLEQLLGIGQDHLKLDENLSTRDLLDLGSQLTGLDSDNLEVHELPGIGELGPGGASIVRLVEDEAQQTLNIFRGLAAGLPTVESIRLSIRNGSGEPGQATEAADEFAARRFQIVDARDDESFDHPQTVLRHTPDSTLFAVFVARFLGPDVVLEEVPTLGGATVEVVTGADWEGVLVEPLELAEVENLLPEELRGTLDQDPASTSTTSITTTTVPSSTSTTAAGMLPEQPEDEPC